MSDTHTHTRAPLGCGVGRVVQVDHALLPARDEASPAHGHARERVLRIKLQHALRSGPPKAAVVAMYPVDLKGGGAHERVCRERERQ